MTIFYRKRSSSSFTKNSASIRNNHSVNLGDQCNDDHGDAGVAGDAGDDGDDGDAGDDGDDGDGGGDGDEDGGGDEDPTLSISNLPRPAAM